MKKVLLSLILLPVVMFSFSAPASDWFVGKFPEKLIRADGRRVKTEQSLRNKMVGVYFSASWCGPCRGFTPKLVKFYHAVREKTDFELVFISFDRSEKNMMKYMQDASMPFLATPFKDPAAMALSRELRVGGIPRLVIFDKDGKILSSNARSEVVRYGAAAVDKWLPRNSGGSAGEQNDGSNGSGFENNAGAAPTVQKASSSSDWFIDKFPAELIRYNRRKVDTRRALRNKMVGVYFSASWCGPCRGFTPKLVRFYRTVRKRTDFELVFISSDKSSEDMMKYMKSARMPFLAAPFRDPAATALSRELRVAGIPRLVIFDKNGRVLSSDARWDVAILGPKAAARWISPDYKPLTYKDWKEQYTKERPSRSDRKRRRRN